MIELLGEVLHDNWRVDDWDQYWRMIVALVVMRMVVMDWHVNLHSDEVLAWLMTTIIIVLPPRRLSLPLLHRNHPPLVVVLPPRTYSRLILGLLHCIRRVADLHSPKWIPLP